MPYRAAVYFLSTIAYQHRCRVPDVLPQPAVQVSVVTRNYLGRLNSTPRSSFNLVVASTSSEESGTLVARYSLKIHSV
jgi:hypothetical protein